SVTRGRYAYDQRCNGLEHLSGESDDKETSENFSISLVTFDNVPAACGAGKVSLHKSSALQQDKSAHSPEATAQCCGDCKTGAVQCLGPGRCQLSEAPRM